MTEITIYRNTEKALANKELNKKILVIERAIASGNKASWQVAVAMTEIVNGELFKEDFKTQKAFASYIGVSQATITQMVNATRFAVERGYLVKNEKGTVDYAAVTFSVGNAYLMSTLDNVEEFVAWLYNKYKKVWLELRQAELKKAIKEYDNRDNEPEQQEVEQEEAEQQEAEQKEAEQENPKEAALYTIYKLMKENSITIEEIQKYMEAEA